MEGYVPPFTTLTRPPVSENNQLRNSDSARYGEIFQSPNHSSVREQTLTGTFQGLHPDVSNIFYNMPILPPQTPFQSFQIRNETILNMSPPPILFSNTPRLHSLGSDLPAYQRMPEPFIIESTSDIQISRSFNKPGTVTKNASLQSTRSKVDEYTHSALRTEVEAKIPTVNTRELIEHTEDTKHSGEGLSLPPHTVSPGADTQNDTEMCYKDQTHSEISAKQDNSVVIGNKSYPVDSVEETLCEQNISENNNGSLGIIHMKSFTQVSNDGTNTSSSQYLDQNMNNNDGGSVSTQINDTLNRSGTSDRASKEWDQDMLVKISSADDEGKDNKLTDAIVANTDDVLELFPFICGICHTEFNRITKFYDHMMSHNGINEQHFHACRPDMEFENEDPIDSPQAVFFKCGLCEKTFKTVCHLHEHVIDSEKLEEYIFDKSTNSIRKCQTVRAKAVSSCNLTTADQERGKTDKIDTDQIELEVDSVNVRLLRSHDQMCSNKLGRKQSAKTSEKKVKKKRKMPARKTRKLPLKLPNNTPVDVEEISNVECDTLNEEIKVEIDTDEIPVDTNHSEVYKDKDQFDDRFLKTYNDSSDVETFKQIEKHQIRLRKKRMQYRNRVQRKKIEKYSKSNEKPTENTVYPESSIYGMVPASDSGDNLQNDNETDPESVEIKCLISEEVDLCENNTEILLSTKLKPVSTAISKRAKFDENGQQIYAGDIMVPCHKCGQMYKKRHLLKHVATHAETRDFICDICSKSFKTKSQLHNHKTNHVLVKNFVCEHCGKPFKTKANLQQHRKTHTAVRDIPCPLCPEMFNNKYILRAHMHRHSDIKSHVCDKCGRGFKRIDQLTRHKYMHTEVRPYNCSKCGKAFKTRRDCLKHEKIHQPFGFFCQYCNKGFVNAHNRKVHLKIHMKQTG